MDEQARTSGPACDGVRMAVLANRLDTIARKMANTLYRTARSGVLNSGHDFSCAILTADCRLLTAAESLPIHIMIGPDLMCRSILASPSEAAARRRLPAQLALPRQLASRRPVHHRALDRRRRGPPLLAAVQGASGRLRQLGAHHLCRPRPRRLSGGRLDLSGRPGAARLPRRCRHRAHVHEPDPRARAVVGRLSRRARRRAHRRARAPGARPRGRLGRPRAACRAVVRLFRGAHARGDRRLPSGRTVVETCHDPFPGVPDGIPLRIAVAINEDSIVVDLRDNPDCQPCGLNLSEACAGSTAMIGVSTASPTIPCRRTPAAFAR